MDLLFDTCWEYQQRGLNKEFTSGNNDSKAVRDPADLAVITVDSPLLQKR